MSNLYKQFKTDKKLEVEGIEVSYGINSRDVETKFRIARAGGANAEAFKKAFEKYSRPHRHLMQAKKLDEKTAAMITRKTFIESCLLGWEGVEDSEGKELPFTPENADKLFADLPELLLDLNNHSQNQELFLESIRELDEGN